MAKIQHKNKTQQRSNRIKNVIGNACVLFSPFFLLLVSYFNLIYRNVCDPPKDMQRYVCIIMHLFLPQDNRMQWIASSVVAVAVEIEFTRPPSYVFVNMLTIFTLFNFILALCEECIAENSLAESNCTK